MLSVASNPIPAQSGNQVPDKYSRAIELLDRLKTFQQTNQAERAEVLSYVSSQGVSVFDINGKKTTRYSLIQLKRELQRKTGRGYGWFKHIGEIYSQPYPQYSSIKYRMVSSGIIINVGQWYRLTFKFEQEILKLSKIEYLVEEVE
jgi:hypothetical protein